MFDYFFSESDNAFGSVAVYSTVADTAALRLGICQPVVMVDNNIGSPTSLGIVGAVADYLSRVTGKRVDPSPSTEVHLVKPPLHGKFLVKPPIDAGGWPDYQYLGHKGYNGQDRMTVRVVVDGRVVEATFFFHVVVGDSDAAALCKKLYRSDVWRIAGPDNYGFDFSSWLAGYAPSASSVSESVAIPFIFRDIGAAAVGEIAGVGLGARISLDRTAAGHGWFVDPTPLNNADDFLPAADPAIWKAKPGSDAKGRRDLLSVLLHEYGHALGLEHSADGRDFMAASLQSGERRPPTGEKLSLMSRLVAELKLAELALHDVNMPPQEVAVVSRADAQSSSKFERVMGICQPVQYLAPGAQPGPGEGGSQPNHLARDYFQFFENRNSEKVPLELPPRSSVQIMRQPKHGKVVWGTNSANLELMQYIPNAGYVGRDRIEYRVNVEGKPVRLVYFVHLTKKHLDDTSITDFCRESVWKISLESPTDSSPEGLAAWQRSAELSALLASANHALAGFSPLEVSAVAQTQGEGSHARITLDTNAAGHGWYVDATPLGDSDNCLPIADRTIWKVKRVTPKWNRGQT